MFRIAFVSNFMNHHQLPFSVALGSKDEIEYRFIATTPITRERVKFGYRDMNALPMVIRTYESVEKKKEAQNFIDDADVVIIGSAPLSYISRRLKNGKLTFKYSERPYKLPITYKNILRRVAGAYCHYGKYKRDPYYVLCASAYTAADMALFRNFENKAYKWGYFPEVIKYENIDDVIANKEENSILWCARYLDWKHPEIPVQIAKRLKNEGYSFTLRMIGSGEMENTIREMIVSEGVTDCVEMLGSMSPERVRENMEHSQIFLFTSDFQEGWGAVLNEAMNSGCAVVASHAIGSVPYLISDTKNGFIYANDDTVDIYTKVKALIEDKETANAFGKQAYKTVTDVWNAEEATNRFLKMAKEIQEHGYCDLYKAGPCSRAEIIKNDWYTK